jgi:hypothetical protein
MNHGRSVAWKDQPASGVSEWVVRKTVCDSVWIWHDAACIYGTFEQYGESRRTGGRCA